MGTIMTFNKICLVSLEDLGKNAQHLTDLQEVKSLDHRVKKMILHQSLPTNSSRNPVTESYHQFGEGEKFVPSTATDDDDIVHDSKTHYSGTYEGNTVFPALLQGMLVGY